MESRRQIVRRKPGRRVAARAGTRFLSTITGAGPECRFLGWTSPFCLDGWHLGGHPSSFFASVPSVSN